MQANNHWRKNSESAHSEVMEAGYAISHRSNPNVCPFSITFDALYFSPKRVELYNISKEDGNLHHLKFEMS